MALWDIAGPMIGLWGAGRQRKAWNRAASDIAAAGAREADAITGAVSPLTDTLGWSLPMAKTSGMNLWGANLGKPSPLITAKYGEAAKGIESEKQRALAESRQHWLSAGNEGRGRGEALRIGQSATDAMNRLNIGEAEAQEGYKDTQSSRFMGWLGSMVDLGKTGISGLMDAARARFGAQRDAAQVRAGGQADYAGQIGALAGDIWGGQQAEAERRWLEDLYRQAGLWGAKKTTSSTGSSNKYASIGPLSKY